ncbi:hypothetical protein GCM10010206_28290 [Streptomyces cinerochromogenes]|nr:hypothetical protein GCM10010206_28290 [Streptomyces cinerochromogenes]
MVPGAAMYAAFSANVDRGERGGGGPGRAGGRCGADTAVSQSAGPGARTRAAPPRWRGAAAPADGARSSESKIT